MLCPEGRPWQAESGPDVVLEVRAGNKVSEGRTRQKLGMWTCTTLQHRKSFFFSVLYKKNPSIGGFSECICFLPRYCFYFEGHSHLSPRVYLYTLFDTAGCVMLSWEISRNFLFSLFSLFTLRLFHVDMKNRMCFRPLCLPWNDPIVFSFTCSLSAGRGRSTSAFCIYTTCVFT